MALWNTASTPKVPLPCIKMASQPDSRETPPRARMACRTSATKLLNSQCQEPASWSMACLTASEVVSGPGVNSKASWEVGNFGVMVIEWRSGNSPVALGDFTNTGRLINSHALLDGHRSRSNQGGLSTLGC